MVKSRYDKYDSLDSLCKWAENVPFVGVYRDPCVTQDTTVDPHNLSQPRDEELPVSWVGTSQYGSMAMLGTEHDYKRKGLASLIVGVIAEIHVELGLIPIAHVNFENMPAREVADKIKIGENTHNNTYLFDATKSAW